MIKQMKLLFVYLCLFFNAQIVLGNEIVTESISINIKNKERLQRGAKLFMNYCSGCHSLKYMRYSQMAGDLGLINIEGQVDNNLLNNLIFTKATMYDPIHIAMSLEDAKQWFRVVPPDLSLSARERGAVWLYNYLKSFYNDNTRPFGVNNLLVPNVAMPNVLEPLIGQMVLVSNNESHLSYLLLVKQGEISPTQADSALQDLVTFLVYVSEPNRLLRYRLGVFVIIFLCIFLVVVYRLNTVYWRGLRD